jgi:hypothetical protein
MEQVPSKQSEAVAKLQAENISLAEQVKTLTASVTEANNKFQTLDSQVSAKVKELGDKVASLEKENLALVEQNKITEAAINKAASIKFSAVGGTEDNRPPKTFTESNQEETKILEQTRELGQQPGALDAFIKTNKKAIFTALKSAKKS